MTDTLTQWLLTTDAPWTRYRVLMDLLDRPDDDADVQAARANMLAHPQVQNLITQAATWGDRAFKRHNDARYPIYAFSTLADFGMRASDAGIAEAIAKVLAHQAEEGAFQSVVNIAKHFGGDNADHWTWILCDTPTLLYALLSFGLSDDERVQKAITHLTSRVANNGWQCVADSALGKFRGPGRKNDPCPIANVYALKALALTDQNNSPAAHAGVEMLLWHWAHQKERKIYMFGIGTDFRKLKYPLVWYNILHVVEVLSHFPFVYTDVRFKEMLAELVAQADAGGRYTAVSMYRAWKDWGFANKKQPSPWITFLVQRIQKRIARNPL